MNKKEQIEEIAAKMAELILELKGVLIGMSVDEMADYADNERKRAWQAKVIGRLGNNNY